MYPTKNKSPHHLRQGLNLETKTMAARKGRWTTPEDSFDDANDDEDYEDGERPEDPEPDLDRMEHDEDLKIEKDNGRY